MRAWAILGLAVLPACEPAGTLPGMAAATPRAHSGAPRLVELARAAPPSGHRALVVVYPRTACSGSASTVFMDRRGRFLGAVGPGTAALLTVPRDLDALVAVSSVEVSAPLGRWGAVDEIAVPPL